MTPAVKGFLGALVAVLLSVAAWHVYLDHRNLHALVDMVVAQQQAQMAQPKAVEPKPDVKR